MVVGLVVAGCAGLGRTATVPAGLGPEPARLSAHVRVLASDAFEGRKPGTAGEARTIEYLIEQFKLAGAEPASPDGSWTHTVDVHRFAVQGPVRAVLTGGSGPGCGGDVASGLVAATRREGGAVDVRAAPLVFGGHGVTAPERNWDDYAGVDVAGKVVLVLMNDPDWTAEEGAGGPFGGASMTYYGRGAYKMSELARRGAAGALLVHREETTGVPFSVMADAFRAPAVDTVPSPESRLPFEAWMTHETAAAWLACAGLELEKLETAAREPGFHALPVGDLRLGVGFDVAVTSEQTRNVVAMVRGAVRPAESFLYTAHWDHLGIGRADPTGDTIYNGALDNAGGVAGLLELARLFAAGPRPARSVVFLATTLEEQGLMGAEAYASRPYLPLETTVGGINMDAVNLFGKVPNMVVAGHGKSDLEDNLERALAPQKRRLEANPFDAVGFYFRSDHFPFAKRGVPFLFPGSGWDIADKLPNTQDPDAGTRFHQPADQWGPELDFAAAASDLTVYYAVGRELANSTAWPRWRDGDEFAALREATAGSRR